MNKKIKLLISSISILALCNVTEVMSMPYVFSSSLYIREIMSGIAYNSSTSPTTRSISKETLQEKFDEFEVSLKKCEEEVSLLCHRIYRLCETRYKSRCSDGASYYVVKKVSKSCCYWREYEIYHLLSEGYNSYYSFNGKKDDEKSLSKQVMTERDKLQDMFQQVQLLSKEAKHILVYRKYKYKYESAITDLKNLAVRLISACECIASLLQG